MAAMVSALTAAMAATTDPGCSVPIAGGPGYKGGHDFTGCYGETVDILDHPVCGNSSLTAFSKKLPSIKVDELEVNKTGQGGSTLITGLPGFIIKNLNDHDEYERMKKFLGSYGEHVKKRKYPSFHRTSLAPVCAVLEMAGQEQSQLWLIMRTVEIPDMAKSLEGWMPDTKEAIPFRWLFRDVEVKEYDIKGPAFAGIGDGKTFFMGDAEVKGKKDFGFTRTFPDGIKLGGCGSRDAAIVLGQDTDLLRKASFTDYSLLMVSYPHEVPACPAGGKPVFPLILEGSGGGKKVRFAVAIIDYLEARVNEGCIGKHFSTMRPPDEFRTKWMQMFPKYFSLPDMPLDQLKEEVGELEEGSPIEVCAIHDICADCHVEVGTLGKIVGYNDKDGTAEVDWGGKHCDVAPKMLAPAKACTEA